MGGVSSYSECDPSSTKGRTVFFSVIVPGRRWVSLIIILYKQPSGFNILKMALAAKGDVLSWPT